MTRILLFSLLLSSLAIVEVYAQEKKEKEEDPYAEYEYLWADEKDKKKKKRKKKDKETEVKKEIVKKDTLIDNPKDVVLDTTSLRNSNLRMKADTLPNTSADTTINQASDTIPEPSADSTQLVEPAPAYDQEPVAEPADTVRQKQAVEPADDSEVDYSQPKEEYYDDPFAEEKDAEKEAVQNTEAETIAEDEDEEKIKPIKDRKPLDGRPYNDFRTQGAPVNANNNITGGFTYTQIGDEGFVGMNLYPEFRIWKIGLGLDIPVLFSLDDYQFRDEIYTDGIGVGRLIRYMSFGQQKKDQVYFRVGQLDNMMIGFGGLVNNYTNSISFEKRKLGVHYDFHFKGLVGIEGMYSDFNPESRNLLVTRPYIRPLSWTVIPIARTLELGTTFASDRDQTENYVTDSTTISYNFLQDDGISAFGFDAGITLLNVPFIQIDAFFNYSRLNLQSGGLADTLNNLNFTEPTPTLDDGYQDGTGTSVGVNFRFNFIADMLSTDVRIERLSYTQHYLPQFFDVTYELNKDARIFSTVTAPEMSGIYGSLTGHIFKIVQIGGSLMLPDEISAESPATVRLNADVHRLADKISLHGSYIKGNLSDLSDTFVLDERSVAKLRFIYHMNKFLAVGVDYFWAFTPTADGGYEPQRYISPYFGLSIDF